MQPTKRAFHPLVRPCPVIYPSNRSLRGQTKPAQISQLFCMPADSRLLPVVLVTVECPDPLITAATSDPQKLPRGEQQGSTLKPLRRTLIRSKVARYNLLFNKALAGRAPAVIYYRFGSRIFAAIGRGRLGRREFRVAAKSGRHALTRSFGIPADFYQRANGSIEEAQESGQKLAALCQSVGRFGGGTYR